MNEKLISVIVPCLNEEEIIQHTHEELSKFCKKINHFNYELIYINDGSTDNTWNLLKNIQVNDPHVRIIQFSRNFGHQIAITAGIDRARSPSLGRGAV